MKKKKVIKVKMSKQWRLEKVLNIILKLMSKDFTIKKMIVKRRDDKKQIHFIFLFQVRQWIFELLTIQQNIIQLNDKTNTEKNKITFRIYFEGGFNKLGNDKSTICKVSC